MDQRLDKCVWMWAGLTSYRLCDRGYECSDCPVDRVFRPGRAQRSRSHSERSADERAPLSAAVRDRFHDPQHLWLRVLPQGQVQVGIDPMGCQLLRTAADVELPRAGVRLLKGDPIAEIHLASGPVSFGSPLAGEVVRVHKFGPNRFRSMASGPYTRAWLMILSVPRLERQLADCLFGRTAWLRLKREWARFREDCAIELAELFSPAPVLPDGGELDLDRLAEWAGPRYVTLVRRWIGTERSWPGRIRAGGVTERLQTSGPAPGDPS